MKCPYRDSEYTCESTLQEREIKAVSSPLILKYTKNPSCRVFAQLVEPEVYQQHLAKSIAQAENNAGNNAFHCKTPDCPGWCIYDDDVNNFLCPVCGVNNCLTCQVRKRKMIIRRRSIFDVLNRCSRRRPYMLAKIVNNINKN